LNENAIAVDSTVLETGDDHIVAGPLQESIRKGAPLLLILFQI
jgi:hypothetical protein